MKWWSGFERFQTFQERRVRLDAARKNGCATVQGQSDADNQTTNKDIWGWKSGMKGAMVCFSACEDQLTAAAQVFADRWRGHGMWHTGILQAAEYALALPDGG